MFVKLLASEQSVEIKNIPGDHYQVGEVEDDEEEHDSKESVDLVVVVVGLIVRPGGVFIYQTK